MTVLDIRIKYRFDTGLSPTYGKDAWGHNYRNGLTYDYAKWLEEYTEPSLVPLSMTWQRDYFLKETGIHAAYYNKYKNLCYTTAYKEWLEELLCRTLTFLKNESNK